MSHWTDGAMAAIEQQTDETCALTAGPFRLTFLWEHERWSHRLQVGDVVLARSVEWSAEAGDPERVVSPAYQQLTAQGDGQRVQALAVGQWGRHHFSGVFTLACDGEGATLDVDAAVRTRAGLAALASTYRVHLTSGSLLDAGPRSVSWAIGPPFPGRLGFEPGPDGRVTLAEAGRLETQVQADVPVAAGDASHRLVYRWRWDARG